MTFLLLVPMDSSAEVKQLICKEEKPIENWDDDLLNGPKEKQQMAAAQIRECEAFDYYSSYSITFDASLLDTGQPIDVELEYNHCVSVLKRPQDNGVKRMGVSVGELSVFHYGTSYFFVNRNSLEWGIRSRYSDYKLGFCEIKDIDTSKRKL